MIEKVLGVTREALHREARAARENDLREAANRQWLLTRPPRIQDLLRRFPTNLVYRVKEGAPYRVTGPGSIGTVEGARESERGEELVFDAFILRFRENEITERQKNLLDGAGCLRVGIAPEWLEEDVLDH